jgi:Fe-Mn family superoxide dismutase
MAFELPKLPYAYDALEPHIDARTMEIHHGKHHAGYTNNLNAAIEGTDLAGKSIEDILKNLDMNNAAVRNNGGGYYNHDLFWKVMSPNGGGQPTGTLADAINAAFGSYEGFKDAFAKAAATRFGSGWAWLVKDSSGKLSIISTANAGTPLTDGLTPLLTCDVWEHAYYIDTRNARPAYLENFWKLVNWDFVAQNLK